MLYICNVIKTTLSQDELIINELQNKNLTTYNYI